MSRFKQARRAIRKRLRGLGWYVGLTYFYNLDNHRPDADVASESPSVRS